MRSVPPPLADLLASRMAVLGIGSGRELARRCGIGKDTAIHILTGRRPSPSEATLQRLADGLGIPIQRLRHAAGRPAGERTPFLVPTAWDGLTLAHRDLLYRIAGAFLQSTDPNSVAPDTVERSSITTGDRTRFAARHDDTNSPHVKAVFSDGP